MMRIRATLIAAMLLAVTSVASGGENPPAKINLTEACRLAQLSADGWRDAKLFEELMASSGSKPRSAFYVTYRLETMAIAPGDGRSAFAPKGRLLSDPMFGLPFMRSDTMDAIQRRKKLAKECWLVSVASLGSGDAVARANATGPLVLAIGHTGSVNALILLLNDPAQTVRYSACSAPRNVPGTNLASPAIRRLIPFLAVRVLRDPVPSVRAVAAHLLGKIVGAGIPEDDDFYLSPGSREFRTVRKWAEENCDLTVLRREEGEKTDLPKGKVEGIDLSEAYYLGRCVRAGWGDDRFFGLLMKITADKELQSHYLLRRLLACLSRAHEAYPARKRRPRMPSISACLSRVHSEIPALALEPGEVFEYAPDPDEPDEVFSALGEEDYHGEIVLLWPAYFRSGNIDKIEALLRKAESAFDRLDALGDAAFLAWAAVVRAQLTAERVMAAKALQKFPKRAETTDLLIMLLNDPMKEVRQEAAESLRGIGDKKLIPFLAVRATYDGDSICRTWAVSTLAGLVGIKLSYEEHADRTLILKWINENCDTSIFDEFRPSADTKE
jgi:HEAT repeat protein